MANRNPLRIVLAEVNDTKNNEDFSSFSVTVLKKLYIYEVRRLGDSKSAFWFLGRSYSVAKKRGQVALCLKK